jgi:tetratricopeptide (TPR) repeat protein
MRRLLEGCKAVLEKNEEIPESRSGPVHIAQSFSDLGNTYYSEGKPELALRYYEQALALLEPIGTSIDIAMCLNNIGTVYHTQGNLKRALGSYERALALLESGSNPQANDPKAIAICLNNIGTVYHSQGVLEEALIYYEEALSLRKQTEDTAGIAQSLSHIGFVYQQRGQLMQAVERFVRVLDLYEHLGSELEPEVAEVLDELATCYAQLGEFEKSLAIKSRSRNRNKS